MQEQLVANKDTIRQIIAEVFANDKNQGNYFIYDEAGAVEHTFIQNGQAIDQFGGSFYKLLNGQGQLQGFMNVVPSLKMLFSFGLKQECRTKENKDSFMAIMDKLLPQEVILVSLYAKNTRAIKWLESYGFEREEQIVLKKTRHV